MSEERSEFGRWGIQHIRLAAQIKGKKRHMIPKKRLFCFHILLSGGIQTEIYGIYL